MSLLIVLFWWVNHLVGELPELPSSQESSRQWGISWNILIPLMLDQTYNQEQTHQVSRCNRNKALSNIPPPTNTFCVVLEKTRDPTLFFNQIGKNFCSMYFHTASRHTLFLQEGQQLCSSNPPSLSGMHTMPRRTLSHLANTAITLLDLFGFHCQDALNF